MSAGLVSFRFLLLICACVHNEKGHLGHEMHFCGGKNIRDNFWESYQNCTHINLHSACVRGKSRMWCRRRSNCKTLRRQSTLVVRFNQAQNTLPHQQLTQLTTNCGQIREEWTQLCCCHIHGATYISDAVFSSTCCQFKISIGLRVFAEEYPAEMLVISDQLFRTVTDGTVRWAFLFSKPLSGAQCPFNQT